MHFFYLDESGCSGDNLDDKQEPIFVLGGISVDDDKWSKTIEAYQQIISDYFDGCIPFGFELHSHELLSPSGDGHFAGHPRDRRNQLALNLLALLNERSHQAHYFAIDKGKMKELLADQSARDLLGNEPYVVAYDYLVTYLDWFISTRGRTARGMVIIDVKDQYIDQVESISYSRRFEGAKAHRLKKLVEFTYPVASEKHQFVQMSDLVVFSTRKFLEIDLGYRSTYPKEAKDFYAKCYSLVHDRLARKAFVERRGRNTTDLNKMMSDCRAIPRTRWRTNYSIS